MLQVSNKTKSPAEGKPQHADAASTKDSTEINPLWQSLSLRSLALQRIAISQPDDPYEREADRVADQVMRTTAPQSARGFSISSPASLQAQRRCAPGNEEDEEKRMRRKADNDHPGAATSSLPAVDRDVTSSGYPLDPLTRAFFEPRFGRDLGSVRVHTDSAAQEYAHDLSAKALTLGHDVYFSRGRYQPHTFAGRKLIAHELSHIVTSGAAGPDRPMLDPDSPEEHEARLREMLGARRFRDRRFWDYLAAHGDSVDVAQAVLLDSLAHDASLARVTSLLNGLVRRFPDRRQTIEDAMRTKTEALRTTARANVQAMWDQYESAAFVYAMVQWSTDQLAQIRRRSPRRRRGAPRPEPSPIEAQFEEWQATANERFAEIRAQRKATYDAAILSLSGLMSASGALSFSQEQLLNELSDYMQGGLAFARRERLRSFYNLQTLLYLPDASVLEQYAAAQQRQTTAGTRVTETRARREGLESAPEGETARAARQRERSLRGARRSEKGAARELSRAERALTPAGAANAEMRQHLEWLETDLGETREELEQSQTRRDTKLADLLPTETRDGVDLALVLDETQRWSIYHRALTNIGGGFPGFSQEKTSYTVIKQRSRVIADQRAAGIASSLSEGTYSGHGEGQYDINAAAGAEIVAVQPNTVDLTRILGPDTRAPGPRIFTRVESNVRSVDEIGPETGDADVLAKLEYGFFGRTMSRNREQVTAYFEGASDDLPARAPDASRVLAGLLFENTIAGSAITAPIEAERVRVRGQMEEAIRADLVTRGIVVPADDAILGPVDASTNQFAGSTSVRIGTFRALTNPSTGKSFTGEEARNAVLRSTRRVLLADSGVISGLEGLMRTLRASHRAGRSGPAVELIHHYREDATGEEVWVVVAYRHLREIAPGLAANQPVTPEQIIAEVGSSGNAVSPHVHMSITVFENNPGRFTKRPPIGFLEPLDFFPMMRRARGTAGTTVPSAGTSPPTAPEAPGAASAVPAQPGAQPPALQPKLAVSQPGDPFEQEADRIAEQVTASAGALPQAPTSGPLLQRACACGGSCPKCSAGTQENEGVRVQTKPTGGAGAALAEAPPAVTDTLRSPGTPLEPDTRAFMESRFGHDFGGVRVHTDAKAAESARAVRARAYTVGSDIAFGPGEYATATTEGERLLAHELVHIVQQSASPSGAGARLSPSPESEFRQVSERPLAGMLPQGAIRTGAPPHIARQPEPLHPLAENELVDKFAELYARLPEKMRTRLLKRDTVAMGIAVDSEGYPRLIYTVAGNRRYKALDNAADEMGIMRWEPRARAEGRGKVGAPEDAEQLMLEGQDEETRVVAIAASRKICKDCDPAMKAEKVHAVDPQKFLDRLKMRVGALSPSKATAPKPAPAPGAEGEAVEAVDTPPVPKLPKAGKTPSPKKGKAGPSGVAVGGAVAGTAVGVGVMLAAQGYFQELQDKANAVKYEQFMRDVQPQIEATIAAQEPAIKKLTEEGQAVYANVTLRLSYMTAPDIQTEIGTASLASVRVEKITIAGSPGPVKEEEIPFEPSVREIASRLIAEVSWSYVMVSYPVKLADALEEQRSSAEDEIAFLDELIDELRAGGEGADEELEQLLAEREEAAAHRGSLEEARAEIERRREKRRQEQANEEKRKQQQALRNYESMQRQPPPKASAAGLLPGPGPVAPPAESLPLPAPLLAADDKVAKADEMSHLFVAQKDKLAAWAERLRASASAGQTGTPEYQNSYRKFAALRDPWPSQLRESLKWLRQNVLGAGQAIERLGALDDWLKTGGWDSLNQVTKP